MISLTEEQVEKRIRSVHATRAVVALSREPDVFSRGQPVRCLSLMKNDLLCTRARTRSVEDGRKCAKLRNHKLFCISVVTWTLFSSSDETFLYSYDNRICYFDTLIEQF